MAAKKSSGGGGGIKGFLTRAGSSFYAGGLYAREKGAWLAQKAGRIGFIIATTSIVTLMPLIFEITREGQMIETEKQQVKDFRGQGYSDRQTKKWQPRRAAAAAAASRDF
mmetsp:Transcript_14702/g.35201  ORF Transcript_14702/g.35201 Transcript_14702/m.35201 type:complete len:110 (+) Transcript_14702:183-512(+)